MNEWLHETLRVLYHGKIFHASHLVNENKLEKLENELKMIHHSNIQHASDSYLVIDYKSHLYIVYQQYASPFKTTTACSKSVKCIWLT